MQGAATRAARPGKGPRCEMPFKDDDDEYTYVEERPFRVPSLDVVIDLNNPNQVDQIFFDISEELDLANGDPEKRSALLTDKARLTKKVGSNGKNKKV